LRELSLVNLWVEDVDVGQIKPGNFSALSKAEDLKIHANAMISVNIIVCPLKECMLVQNFENLYMFIYVCVQSVRPIAL
jgi:hypothetical protein